MGYTTSFKGGLKLNRELTHKEWIELRELSSYERQVYERYTDTPDTIADSYLQWEPNEDGTHIVWNGGEKFYDYIQWLRWLIKHYLKPHELVVNGSLEWQGELLEDRGIILAVDNKITVKKIDTSGYVKCPSCACRFNVNEVK